LNKETNIDLHLEAELSASREQVAQLERDFQLLEHALAVLPDPIGVFDLEGNYLWWNQALTEITGYSDQDMASLDPTDLFSGEERQRVKEAIEEVVTTGGAKVEASLVTKEGEHVPFEFVGALMRDEEGIPFAVSSVGRNITERKQVREELTRQAQEILELSTPAVQVWEGVVAVPLIGTLDSDRTQRFMDVLLQTIVDTDSEIALVDITGVPAIDTLTAQHLIETITAVRLLGADVILTGVRPAIAQTLVHLGVDLSGITTRSSLAAGLRVALDRLGEES
jgi:PAS domain S-box-containing protein